MDIPCATATSPSSITLHRVVSVKNRLSRLLGEFVWASGPEGEGVYEFHVRDGGVRLSGFTPFGAGAAKRSFMDEMVGRFIAVNARGGRPAEANESRAFADLMGWKSPAAVAR